ncbi:MAG: ABC transporter substrate-binding protein [Candidatus Lambdaproteobacteria bacterium]|nr:ABC transporter substrate-binding protein [Candidatus Lambdaproteobacteria bacterium]
MHRHLIGLLVTTVVAIGTLASSPLYGQKYGGILRGVIRDSPPDLSIHETNITDVVIPMSAVYSRLVAFDELELRDRPEDIRPNLAERWEWRADNRELVFHLRPNALWHDGKPATSADVKQTFDGVRGAKRVGFKLNPRKPWYTNIEDIVTEGDHVVVFKLKRPQPSLLSMLATGYAPVYPAHVPAAELRLKAVGTGPFKLKEFKRGERLIVEKNLDYFVKGRPYLDGVHYIVIREVQAQAAALIARQVDVGLLLVEKPVYDNLKAANTAMLFQQSILISGRNILINGNKPPFNDPELRLAINLALERASLVKTVYGGAAVIGAAMLPTPYGIWGLTPEQLSRLPGFGDPARNKAESRRILAAKGYTAEKPLKVTVTTRNIAAYLKPATWAIGELKGVGIDAELKQVDGATWWPILARRDFQLGSHTTAYPVDDPDANYYENYTCGSQRNYTDYCNPELQKRMDVQSAMFDYEPRKAIVQEIDETLQREGARAMLAYQFTYHAYYPYVKNLKRHQSTFNGWGMENAWLDK